MFSLHDILIPLLACFILVGIHAYLGVHVLARKVIFVDLALAQIAALGAVYALFLGLSFDYDPLVIKFISVIFSFLGALIISLSKIKHPLIPHEALIGIIYATALSLTLLLSSNLAHGADEINQLLSGSILWVSDSEIFYTSILYIIIGLVHIVFRKQFFAISYGKAISNKVIWDFLFYVTFGIVVTSSVGIGGVLLVFGYLIIPSVIGVLLGKSTKSSIIFAWLCGVLASIIGVIFSYYYDYPSGPCIVVTLSIFLLVTLMIKNFLKIFAVILIVLSSVFAIYYSFNKSHEHHIVDNGIIENLSSVESQKNIDALNSIDEDNKDLILDYAILYLASEDYNLKFAAVETISKYIYVPAIPQLIDAFNKEEDLFLKMEIAKCLSMLGEKKGIYFLSTIFVQSSNDIIKQEIIDILESLFVNELNIDIINKIFYKRISFEFQKNNNKFKIK